MDRNLVFKGFRGVDSCELQNLAPLNILVGRNGSGKTGCLEALLLHHCALQGAGALDFVIRHRIDTAGTGARPWLNVSSLFSVGVNTLSIEIDGKHLQLRPNGDYNVTYQIEDGGGIAGCIGLSFMARHVVTFDFPNGVLYLRSISAQAMR